MSTKLIHNNELKVTRRQWLEKLGVLTSLTLLPIPISATPEDLRYAIEQRFGQREIQTGRVNLSLPALAENGNSVRIQVDVDSPMDSNNHVRSLQLFAEANPLPDIARFEFSPYSGKAAIETRIRLAAEQDVVAIAEFNDDSLWSGAGHIVVTEAACLEALI
jgi:sulfur-oxidizing protein SoxY